MGVMVYFGNNTALFWVLLSAAFLLIAISAILLIRNYRSKQRLREAVLKIQKSDLDADKQLDMIRQILADAGYAFDEMQGIYYSVMNPWQGEMGYCRLYDQWATPLGMVFDSEPVRFDYNGKKWLIEFWKGQYGITAGGEIGIYNTTGPDIHIPGIFNGTYYHRVNDDEMLNMEFTLKKSNVVMFIRADRHWWLTGFVLGEFSEPSALTMEASVTFRDIEMRDAFTEALRKLGYSDSDIWRFNNTVMFTFATPRSKQPSMRRGFVYYFAMRRNRLLVSKYREITKGLTSIYDILMTLKARSPVLYRLSVNIDKKRIFFRFYKAIRRFLT